MANSIRRIDVVTLASCVAMATLFGRAAHAADLLPNPPLVAPPVWSWVGCYGGIQGGGMFGSAKAVSNSPGTVGLTVNKINTNDKDGSLGGTLGCGGQFRIFAGGIELDFASAGLGGKSSDMPPFPSTFTNRIQTHQYGTVRGRFGIALDRTFYYFTGGVVFTNFEFYESGPGIYEAMATDTMGWTTGVGVEYMLSPQWSVKAEYLFMQVPKVIDSPAAVGVNNSLNENVFRVGVNWHFNGGLDALFARR